MQVISLPRHSHSVQWPSWTTPKAFLAITDSSDFIAPCQRPCLQQKYFLLLWSQTDDALTAFFIQDCHLPIQWWSTRAHSCDASFYQPQILEEQCWQPTAGSWKFLPASFDVSSSCCRNAGGTQCTVIAPGIALEHGHNTHLYKLMGKDKIGRCHPLNLLSINPLHLCHEWENFTCTL